MRLCSLLSVSIVVLGLAAVSASSSLAGGAQGGKTIDLVRQRGHLICGTSRNEIGFSATSKTGKWAGIYVDLCRALAAAVLGDANAVKYRPLSAQARYSAVANGEVDVLSRGTAWTLSRDTEKGVVFVGPFFHDGTGFLIRRSSRITSVLELSGASICFVSGGLVEATVGAFFNRRDMKFVAVGTETWAEAAAKFDGGRCLVLAADQGRLAVERSQFVAPESYVILPEMASADVFGPVVRADDVQWLKVVRWVVFALIAADDLGVDAAAVSEANRSPDEAVRRFATAAIAGANALGLADDWLVKVIGGVGHYGEIFDRHLGAARGVKLKRGRNQPISRGGALFAPAFR